VFFAAVLGMWLLCKACMGQVRGWSVKECCSFAFFESSASGRGLGGGAGAASRAEWARLAIIGLPELLFGIPIGFADRHL
jgi:hypothetical protein